ncbi:MAG TPA: NAD-dependent epimerase/dehydratase family protein [Xanthobacteraceae bacterium]|jgi:CDP-paratose 2-epimerase
MNVARPIRRRAAGRVLITGGCGFLGCNIAAALAGKGRSVIALDNLSRTGARENAQWLVQHHPRQVAVERADTRDREAMDRLVRGVDAVMHLAAQVAVTTSIADPIEDFEINARGTLNLLEAVRRHNPDAAVIFASTNKVYGALFEPDDIRQVQHRYVPNAVGLDRGVSERVPLDLHSPYGCSKGTADQYVRDYARVFGLRTVVLRMSCIYGPRQFGNEDQGWIAHFLLQAIRETPITIYGDGYQVRDALFVGDAADAWIRTLDRIEDVSGRIFNLGGGPGNAVSLRELIELIGDLRGRRPECRFAEWRPGDQPWYVSDISAISGALGWQPRTSLRQGLRALAQWLDSRIAASAPELHLQTARA